MILSSSIIITVIGKVNLGHNASVCDNIREFPEIQIESQKLIAAVQVDKVFPLAKYKTDQDLVVLDFFLGSERSTAEPTHHCCCLFCRTNL